MASGAVIIQISTGMSVYSELRSPLNQSGLLTITRPILESLRAREEMWGRTLVRIGGVAWRIRRGRPFKLFGTGEVQCECECEYKPKTCGDT